MSKFYRNAALAALALVTLAPLADAGCGGLFSGTRARAQARREARAAARAQYQASYAAYYGQAQAQAQAGSACYSSGHAVQYTYSRTVATPQTFTQPTPQAPSKVGPPIPEPLPTAPLPGKSTPQTGAVQSGEAAPLPPRVRTASVAQAVAVPSPPVAPAVDPYGFTNWLNATRAAYGLSAVGYDPNLTNWAHVNNSHQNAYGMGHHIMGAARRQNSGWGAYSSMQTGWMNSPGHRSALLDPTIRWIGIANDGAYWTFNGS